MYLVCTCIYYSMHVIIVPALHVVAAYNVTPVIAGIVPDNAISYLTGVC